jgi:hypothetical protein
MTPIDELQADPPRGLSVAVGALTAFFGLLVLAFPITMLHLLDAGPTDPAPYIFGIVGLFMLLFGGLLVDAARRPEPPPVALFWCFLQKVAATVAMLAGFITDVYGWLALLVAVFDGASALIVYGLWRREALRHGP